MRLPLPITTTTRRKHVDPYPVSKISVRLHPFDRMCDFRIYTGTGQSAGELRDRFRWQVQRCCRARRKIAPDGPVDGLLVSRQLGTRRIDRRALATQAMA